MTIALAAFEIVTPCTVATAPDETVVPAMTTLLPETLEAVNTVPLAVNTATGAVFAVLDGCTACVNASKAFVALF